MRDNLASGSREEASGESHYGIGRSNLPRSWFCSISRIERTLRLELTDLVYSGEGAEMEIWERAVMRGGNAVV